MEVSKDLKQNVYALVPNKPEIRDAVDTLIELGVISEKTLQDLKIWHTYRLKLQTVEKKMYAVYDTCIELECSPGKVYKVKHQFNTQNFHEM